MNMLGSFLSIPVFIFATSNLCAYLVDILLQASLWLLFSIFFGLTEIKVKSQSSSRQKGQTDPAMLFTALTHALEWDQE